MSLVALGPLRRDLMSIYLRWHNDVATTRTFALRQPTTLELSLPFQPVFTLFGLTGLFAAARLLETRRHA